MNHLLSFKTKVLVCGLVCTMFFATGIIVFAMSETPGKKVDTTQSLATAVAPDKKDQLAPVVILDDGKEKRVVSLPDFLKLANASSSVSVDKPEQANAQLLDLIRLQNQVEIGKKQIELLEKMIKQTEKKPDKKDSWWQEGMKSGFKNYKEILSAVGKYLAGKVVSFTVNGALIIGSVWVAYKIIWPPIYCHTPLPSIFYGLSSEWFLGSRIPGSWYSEKGVCSGYYPSTQSLDPRCNWDLIERSGGIIPKECLNIPVR